MQRKWYPARPWFTGSLVIPQVSYFLGIMTGSIPASMETKQELEREKSLEEQAAGEKNLKYPGESGDGYLFRQFQKIFQILIK